MNTEIYSIISSIVVVLLGGGWFTHYRAHKRQENAKATQEEANAKQIEADAFKSMQDAYQQMHEDVLNRLKEVCDERDHYRDERDEERKANEETRRMYKELEGRMSQMELQYKRDISRLGRRVDVLSPFLCGTAGCMRRTKVSLMENIDDSSYATEDEREQLKVSNDDSDVEKG